MESYVSSHQVALDIFANTRRCEGLFVAVHAKNAKEHLEMISESYRIAPQVYRWGQLIAWNLACEQLGLQLGDAPLRAVAFDSFENLKVLDRWARSYQDALSGSPLPLGEPGLSEFYLPGALKVCQCIKDAMRLYEAWVDAVVAARAAFAKKVAPIKDTAIGKLVDGSFIEEVAYFTNVTEELPLRLSEDYRERFIEGFKRNRCRADLLYPEKTTIDEDVLKFGFDLTKCVLVKTYFAALAAVFEPLLEELGKNRGRDRPADKTANKGQSRLDGFTADCVAFHLRHLVQVSRQKFDRETVGSRLRKSKAFDDLKGHFRALGKFKENANRLYEHNKKLI